MQWGCLDHLYYTEHVHYECTDTLNAETNTGHNLQRLCKPACVYYKKDQESDKVTMQWWMPQMCGPPPCHIKLVSAPAKQYVTV